MKTKMYRRQELQGAARTVVDKVRGNALVAAIQALGGELVLDEAAMVKARGYGITGQMRDDGAWVFKVVEAIHQ